MTHSRVLLLVYEGTDLTGWVVAIGAFRLAKSEGRMA